MWFAVCYSFIIVDDCGELFALDHCQSETVSLLKHTSCLTGSQCENSTPTLPALYASQHNTKYPPYISVSTALDTNNCKEGQLCTLLQLIAACFQCPDSTVNLGMGHHGCFSAVSECNKATSQDNFGKLISEKRVLQAELHDKCRPQPLDNLKQKKLSNLRLVPDGRLKGKE